MNINNTQSTIIDWLFTAMRVSNIRDKDNWRFIEVVFIWCNKERSAIPIYYVWLTLDVFNDTVLAA
jgi:hypothetical protein